MSDRALLFLGSFLLLLLSLASAGYLVATKQVLSLDGIFLTLVSLLSALCFALYLMFVINRAKAELSGKK
jgi:hypothetical protein